MTTAIPIAEIGRRRVAGLTLIELMVALAVVAVLGVISYRAVAAASESRQRLGDEYRRWGDITRFVQMVDTDLLQIATRPSASGSDVSLLLTPAGADGSVELSFLKLDGARSNARRIGYRLDGTQLILLRWPGTDATSVPTRDVVLDRVKSLNFAMLANGQWSKVWPPAPGAALQLPAAIEMKLELADAGIVRRLVSLR
jgi:general secretion pathway protein J